MAGLTYTTDSFPHSDKTLNGGLNSTAGPLTLKNNESSDLQNVDFNKFGSVLKRNGYAALNTATISFGTASITAFADGGTGYTQVTSAGHGLSNDDRVVITGTTSYNGAWIISSVATDTFEINMSYVADDATGDWNLTHPLNGLHWYEYDSSGTTTMLLMCTLGSRVYKMDALDGTWDNITGSITITAGNHTDYANFLNEVYGTNGADPPWKWTGSGNCAAMTVPTDLTDAKYVAEFNNRLFLANVIVDGTAHPSRIYWSNNKTTDTWTATDYIEVSKNDGQEITRIKVLGDRLVIYKTRSIYNLFFTGDADIPFVLPGGGKSNSAVGCVAPFSVQEVNNGHVFMSYDGFYFYDGANSYKISDKINTTITGYNKSKLVNARSWIQKNKNHYCCILTKSGSTENDEVVVWNWFLNAWSIYTNMNISAATTVYVDGTDERPYWGDYFGFVYRGDYGTNDYPLNVASLIAAHYYTNWKHYEDLMDKKGIAHMALYHQIASNNLTLSYSYDFEGGDTYSKTVDMSGGGDVFDTGVFDTATFAKEGGNVQRIDLTGRGRVVRFKFSNETADETFQIDGFGTMPHLETVA